MNHIQFKNLDLNLLRILLALLDNRSVSRAAEELSLTPSAVSHALGRLRTGLGDPLFERRSGGLVPTAYALEAGRQVRQSLNLLRDALNREQFDPATAEREFIVGAGSFAAVVLLPPIVDWLAKVAPGVRFRLRRLEDQSPDDVEHGRLDFIFGAPSSLGGKLEWRPLTRDEMVWVARRGHPTVRDPLTMGMLGEVRHVLIEKFSRVISLDYPEVRRFFDEGRELGDAARAHAGDGRRRGPGAGVIVSDTMHAIAIASQSDFVTLTLRRLAEAFPSGRIQILQPPHPTPPIEFGVIFHPTRLREPGFAWLLPAMTEAAQMLLLPQAARRKHAE